MRNLDIHRRNVQNVRLCYKRNGFLAIQTIRSLIFFIFIGNKMKGTLESVKIYCLILNIGKHIDLSKTLLYQIYSEIWFCYVNFMLLDILLILVIDVSV